MCRQLTFTTLTLVAAIALAGASNPALAREGQSPADVLARHELMRLDRVWILPQEVELRQDLAELPKRRERVLALERELEQRIEQNRLAWQESQPGISALKQALAKLATGDPQRAVIQQQIEAVESTVIEPGRLGTHRGVRSQVVQWTTERHGLSAATVRIRRTLPKLVDRYGTLAQDQDLQLALRRVGEGQRLGPQRSYQGDLQKLGDYEKLVFTRWNPIHWQAGQVRVTGLVDEQLPVTFSWIDASQQPTLLTATAAEAVGLKIADDAPRESVSLSAGRSVTARRVAVPYLRFGACVLRGVSVLVLPPEAEDWGCRIGREALAEHSVRLEPERLRLWIDGT